MKNNRSIKKILALVLVLCFTMCLCGCGKSESIQGEKISITVSGIEGKNLKISFSGPLLSEATLIYPDTSEDENSILTVTKKTLNESKAVFKVKANDSSLAGLEFKFIKEDRLASTASVNFAVTEDLKFTSLTMDLDESPLGESILLNQGIEVYADNIIPSVVDIIFVGEGQNWYISEYDDQIVSTKELSEYNGEDSSEYLWRITAKGIGSTDMKIINNDLKKTLIITLESLPSKEDGYILSVSETKLEGKVE